MKISDKEIEQKAQTYNNAMTSMAEGMWMPLGFTEGAKWMRDKMSSDHALLEEATRLLEKWSYEMASLEQHDYDALEKETKKYLPSAKEGLK